jgi:hypothetical protein
LEKILHVHICVLKHLARSAKASARVFPIPGEPMMNDMVGQDWYLAVGNTHVVTAIIRFILGYLRKRNFLMGGHRCYITATRLLYYCGTPIYVVILLPVSIV